MQSPKEVTTIIFLCAAFLPAQEVTTDPIGFNTVTCLAHSDTVVGVPLRREGSVQTRLSGAPTGAGDSITLPVYTTLTAGQFNATSLSPVFLPKFFAKFTGGAKANFWYSVESNTATSVTIHLNGDNLDGVASDDPILVAEYWTLHTLFPPAGATTSWAEAPSGSGNWTANGHAIVRSDNAITRKTEILVPNYDGTGINLSAAGTFYLLNAGWRGVGSGTADQGATVIYPDGFITIRHNPGATHATTFRSIGEVEMGGFMIPLTTRAGTRQDNHIALSRPIDLRLSDLGLSFPAFLDSPNAINRTDELLVFNNAAALKNRSASATYYRLPGGWRSVGGGAADQGNAEIPAGAGFIIRKAATSTGATAFWHNPFPQ